MAERRSPIVVDDEEIATALLQAHARIDAQIDALRLAALENERANETARRAEHNAQVLQHRLGALEAEFHIVQHKLADALRQLRERDEERSRQRSIDEVEEGATRAAQEAQKSEAQMARTVAESRAEVLKSEGEVAALRADVRAAKEMGEMWRVKLVECEERARQLDNAVAERTRDNDMLRRRISEQQQEIRTWNKERNALLQEVDKNTSGIIRRREELYFTRTNLLKETARLKGELEQQRLPLPSSPPPSSPPATFVRGISPRSPRSVDSPQAFEEEIVSTSL